MMRYLTLLSTVIALTTGAAAAEPLSFGTARAGSSTYSMGLAITKFANKRFGLDLRVVPQKAVTQALPLVDSGETNFGVASAIELSLARSGSGLFKSNKMENLVAVGTLFPFKIAPVVKRDVAADTLAGTKGMRYPYGLHSTSTGEMIWTSMIEAAGMTYDDVKKVPVATFTDVRKAMVAGRTDVAQMVVGSAKFEEMERKVGPLKLLSIDRTEKTDAVVQSHNAALRITTVKGDLKKHGRATDFNVLEYDYMLYTNRNTPDDLVRKLAASLAEGAADMAKSFPAFNNMKRSNLAAPVGLPYHPAARAYYTENAIEVPAE